MRTEIDQEELDLLRQQADFGELCIQIDSLDEQLRHLLQIKPAMRQKVQALTMQHAAKLQQQAAALEPPQQAEPAPADPIADTTQPVQEACATCQDDQQPKSVSDDVPAV